MAPVLTPLPIDGLLPELCQRLAQEQALVLEAAPGAGKTTRVPRAVWEAGLAKGREVVVLEPRRLAARLSAQRVAEELGEPLGETVGYQVRFENVGGPKTRIRFVTEGVLQRRLFSEPTLPSVGLVLLDEFHERHLNGDLALALLRRLQLSVRPDLKLVVMSATLEAAPLAAFLGNCPTLRSEGRRFDVQLEYLDVPDERFLEQQVLAALKRLIPETPRGHVLVFLPGAGEIRRTHEACADFAQRHGFTVLPLHGDLALAEQDRAVRPSAGRKLILATNVAETSITIDGVTAVIDSGVARVASHSPWSGLPTLRVAKVSKASAIQRAGRAGRTQAGHCVRLYTRGDFDARPDHDLPEMARADLAETVLGLKAMGLTDLGAFEFFERPPAAALSSAQELLRSLGAVDGNAAITPLGRRLLDFPLHPRLARVVAEGERRGVGDDAALAAALLGERDVRSESRTRLGPGGRGPAQATRSGTSDVLDMMERMRAVRSGNPQATGLDVNAVQSVQRVHRQLTRHLKRGPQLPEAQREQALLMSLLSGYPDRVAKRRRPHSPEVVFARGGSAELAPTSVVQEPELLIALDAEERSGSRGKVVIRLASAIDPEFLLDLGPDALKDEDVRVWNAEAERVDRLTALRYEGLLLDERRVPAPADEATGARLAQEALQVGIERFVDPDALQGFLARMGFAAQHLPEAGFPAPDSDGFRRVLAQACVGLRSFSELRDASLLDMVFNGLTPTQQQLLQRAAPERVTLPHGKPIRVHYEPGKSPWIESRLQDFFGLRQGPALAQGRVPLVLHLLAPNQRPVQVTTDLAGFWERHYPSVKRELARKYPRHAWPDDPVNSVPTPPKSRR